jgi:hypothetical protein
MRVSRLLCVLLLTSSATMFAESKNPADYPLRIHLFGRNQTTFYHNRVEEEAKGDGRANLFENGMAHGVDFSYECSEKVRASFGYETYPAKWKKPGRELVVLMPVFGKSNTYFTCDFKTDVKSFAYAATKDGRMTEEPADQFKTWMAKHDYDPEHGKNMPVRLQADSSAAKPSEPAPATQQ